MSGVREIKDGDRVLARFVPADWKQGLAFYSGDDEFIQIGTWSYGAGKELLPHVHNTVPRETTRTQEVVFVRKGALRARVYTEEGKLVDEIDARAGDTLVMLAGGHGYTILEEGTEVLEIKNGPYPGAERDRRRFTPA
jgi:hypothetical protein